MSDQYMRWLDRAIEEKKTFRDLNWNEAAHIQVVDILFPGLYRNAQIHSEPNEVSMEHYKNVMRIGLENIFRAAAKEYAALLDHNVKTHLDRLDRNLGCPTLLSTPKP